MSEAAEEIQEDAPSVEDLQAQLADLTKQNESMKAKSDELLGEAKKAKTLKREADEAARKSAEDKARADGDHEQLYKSSEAARIKLQDELNGVKAENANKALNQESFKIASSLADNVVGGAQNATLLSNEIKSRLKYVDGDLKVTDSSGNLTVSSLEDLQTEFKNNPAYSGLLKGNQSSGGSATGGSNSGSAAKVKTRAEFEALDIPSKAKFMADGGKLTN